MGVSRIAYLFLLAAVVAGRLLELRISRANQRKVMQAGGNRVAEPHFNAMVLLHTCVIVGAAVEVIVARRPLIPALAIAMGALFVLSNALRWWVIRIMREHWNVEVMNSVPLGVVASGPYRWVRHPNYLAVYIEMISLPLIHTAWITALGAAVGNAWVLRERLAVEDRVLLADPSYRAAMGAKPRFLPKLL
jgi:methyltransferase